jgi:[protein-PII] uridylyltransferase
VTIKDVAHKVRDNERLSLLAALTEADSRATGTMAWSSWKAGLVRQLVAEVSAVLTANSPGPRPPSGPPGPPDLPHDTDEESADLVRKVKSTGTPAVSVRNGDGFSAITVAAPDRPGLLAISAGVLCLHGLPVLRASARTVEEGTALGRFEVEIVRPLGDRARRIELDLGAALAGELALEPRLARREREYAGARRMRAARPAEVRVIVDDQASERTTLVEVRAPDNEGLLHRIASVLTECGLDVESARANTLGHEVVDTFYVRECVTGAKLDAALRAEVAERLRGSLADLANRS